MKHWLLKTEPGCFSIDDLARAPNKMTFWDGVRNYQARNFMRDDMKEGDLVLFYHSNAEPTGIAGLATGVKEAYPDFPAFDPNHEHYDPKSKPSAPIWMMVDIKLKKKFKRIIPLSELKSIPALSGMVLLQKGSRLSVQPVTPAQYDCILKLVGTK
jgi:predicted RNA-binding protein with PUA-like domain